MINLGRIFHAFDIDKPIRADDNERYVDFSSVRGGSRISARLVQRIINAAEEADCSHHLLMGHTKCGKTTELLRTARLLEENGYATVYFDIAEVASREFEYTTVLLVMAGHVVDQLHNRKDKRIKIKSASTEQLLNFLRDREVKVGQELSGGASGKTEGTTGWLTKLLGDIGIGFELRGGFQRSRDITVKIEADTRGFMKAIKDIISDASAKVKASGFNGLVVICDGCDKLNLNASDEHGHSYDLQKSLFVDHVADLRDVPCHVIYTVPISIPFNLGDLWDQRVVFLPAVPVMQLPDLDDSFPREGRRLLTELVTRRLAQYNAGINDLFVEPDLLDRFIDVCGGHISDLLLLVREAVLEAQLDKAERINDVHVRRSISGRAIEYKWLVEPRFTSILVAIDEYKAAPINAVEYREIMFKRLALEYICDERNFVVLHPLVAASDQFRRLRNPKAT